MNAIITPYHPEINENALKVLARSTAIIFDPRRTTLDPRRIYIGGKIMKIRTLLIIASLFLLLFNCSAGIQAKPQKPKAPKAPTVDVQAELQKGINLYNNDTIPEAINAFNKVVNADSKNATAFYYLGLCSEKQGNNGDAINKYNSAINKKPEYLEALLAKGKLQVKMNQYGNSLDPLNKIVQIFISKQMPPNPLLGDAYYHLGFAQYKLNNADSAIANLQKAITIIPQHPYAHYYLGMAFYNQNKKDLAIEQLNIFLQLAPDAPESPQVRNLLSQIAG